MLNAPMGGRSTLWWREVASQRRAWKPTNPSCHVTCPYDYGRRFLANFWQTVVRSPWGGKLAGLTTRPGLLVRRGAPRRNRTGDPILTMDRRPSAVLAGVSAARSAPWMLQLWAQFLHLHPGRLDRHRWRCQPPDAGVCCRGGISCASCLDPLQHLGRDEDRCRHQRRQVQRLAGPHVGGLDARAPSTDQASPPWVTTRPG